MHSRLLRKCRDFQYAISGGAITITGYSGGGDVIIPSMIAGLPVVRIANRAFGSRTNVTSVAIPPSITNIGVAAFSRCTRLNTIAADPLNSAYRSLDGVLFDKDQTRLIQYPAGRRGVYSIPDRVISVAQEAFASCAGLTSITMGDDVADIGTSAFADCSGLTHIILGNGVARIGIYAFNRCTSLTNFLIPSSVANIGEGRFALVSGFVFDGCASLTGIAVDTNNQSYSSVDGVLFNKSQTALLQYPGGRKGSYTVSESVTSVGYSAFSDCSSLTAVTLGTGVTNIGWYAFSGCSGLTSATISNGVTELRGYAFSDCHGLTNVTIGNNVGLVEELALSNCSALTAVTIGSSVTNFEFLPFYECASLKELYFRGNAPNADNAGLPNQVIAYYLQAQVSG